MPNENIDEKDLAVVAKFAGLELSPERCSAVLPVLQGVRELLATLETVDVGETPPAGAYDARWSAPK